MPQTTVQPKTAPAGVDFLPLEGIDYIEFYVGNAKQTAYYFRNAFGFDITAYAGLETGVRDRASYVLEQGNIRFVFTAALGPDGRIADHLRLHGDGAKEVALRVQDAESAFRETTKRGARAVQEPTEYRDDNGVLKKSAIATYGEVIHTFVERKNYAGVFAPGYKKCLQRGKGLGLKEPDHVVGNVELGEMNEWVNFYRDKMGFSQMLHFDDQDISTAFSALMSKVMQNGTGRIKFPINEPAEGKRKSQIQEYLDYYRSPGVQHIALSTDDIVATVTRMRAAGVEFLYVPTTYYDLLQERVGKIDEPVEDLKRLGILVDRDDEGYLLQIFTKPVQDRPTLFFEVIQRKGSRGFGKGNFKALFESIEREQAQRGNL